jgi:hypothetical protein
MEYIDELILSRDKPRFVLTSTFRAIAEQTENELKRKRAVENMFVEPGGGEGNNIENKNRFKRFKQGNELIGAKQGERGGSPADRETDPEKTNEDVRADWKMSANEFKRVISPYVVTCPKLGNKTVCGMFHIVGRCYFGSQCRHSHEKLTEEVSNEIDQWIKECKQKAKDSPNKQKGKGKNKGD